LSMKFSPIHRRRKGEDLKLHNEKKPEPFGPGFCVYLLTGELLNYFAILVNDVIDPPGRTAPEALRYWKSSLKIWIPGLTVPTPL